MWLLILFAVSAPFLWQSASVVPASLPAVHHRMFGELNSPSRISSLAVLKIRAGNAESALGKLAAMVADGRNMPMFEFGRALGHILAASTKDNDEVGLLVLVSEAELVFQDYMTRLRDYYLQSFKAVVEVASHDLDRVVAYREATWQQCDKAMAAAVPLSWAGAPTTWQYDGFLSELKSDMDAAVEEAESRVALSASAAAAGTGATTTTVVASRPTTWQGRAVAGAKKYGRWLAAQCLLLLFNFAQNEWVSANIPFMCLSFI